MVPCCRRRELPLALTAAGEPVRWQGTTPEGKAMRPANLTQQQYQQLLPLLFEGMRAVSSDSVAELWLANASWPVAPTAGCPKNSLL